MPRRVVVKQQKPQGGGMQAAMKEMANFDEGMPAPYIPPDKNTCIFKPVEAVRMDISRLTVIWPSYLDSSKTLKMGRRVPKACSCPSPTVDDLSGVLEYLQLWHAIEPYKGYPREPWVLGRVRVRIADEDGIPWNPKVPNKMSLMKTMGKLIPNLKSRRERLADEKARKEAEARAEKERERKAAEAAATSQANTKKKGKKKGKR